MLIPTRPPLVVADYNLILELRDCVESAVGYVSARAQDASTPTVPPHTPTTQTSHTHLHTLSEIVAIVKASKERVICQVQQSSLAPNSSSVSKIIETTLSRPKAPKPKNNEVNISLMKVAKEHPIRISSPGNGKGIVEEALTKARVKDLERIKVQGVRLRLNGTLVVNALTDEDTNTILRHLDAWVNELAPGSVVSTRSYAVVANFVPVEFDPREEGARRRVVGKNRAVMEREEEVVGMRWLNGKGQGQQTSKRHSSLVITVNSARLADLLIERNITILGAICNVQKYVLAPVQCYRCQAFGHIATTCPDKINRSSLKCVRCAGQHITN
ncbi:hypothetical protein M422DRAFT_248011 [Sphaerobolus stellatus SS14]|nr:hypothetical protein M422DRAFT_248011 [Sphaerobolus stellatus SS14]